MRQLFLYGALGPNFATVSAPFVRAAGGAGTRIAVLMSAATGWEPHFPRYRNPFMWLGAAAVIPVAPDPDGRLDDRALAELHRSTGIFMCGGDPRQYHRVYVQSEAREVIREAYRSGVPYGGVSAGALMAPERCSIWGDRLTTGSGVLRLRGSEDGCEAELQTGEGLGLLPEWTTEAHFRERGGFPRLVAAMEQAGVRCGLGLDDGVCLQVIDERQVTVHGEGRAWELQMAEPGRLTVRVRQPGEVFALRTERRI